MARQALSLKGQALALLARREHSRQELRTKLLAHARKLAQQALSAEQGQALAQALPAQIEALLDELQACNYLSDARFAESRVHHLAARQGQARIAQELSRHGVRLPDELADQLRTSELSRAQQVWQRRFGTNPSPTDPKERARQMRFLAGRGFCGDVIRRVVGGRADEDFSD
jgi:regulatory protein